tara:strand:+ start:1643 stop:1780 length:138 start_codon:yes stop_codon:yes gene_type:complete
MYEQTPSEIANELRIAGLNPNGVNDAEFEIVLYELDYEDEGVARW